MKLFSVGNQGNDSTGVPVLWERWACSERGTGVPEHDTMIKQRFSMVAHAFNSSMWEAEAGRVLWQFQASQCWRKPDKWEDKINECLSAGCGHRYAAQRSPCPAGLEEGRAGDGGDATSLFTGCSPNRTYHSLCSPCPGWLLEPDSSELPHRESS